MLMKTKKQHFNSTCKSSKKNKNVLLETYRVAAVSRLYYLKNKGAFGLGEMKPNDYIAISVRTFQKNVSKLPCGDAQSCSTSGEASVTVDSSGSNQFSPFPIAPGYGFSPLNRIGSCDAYAHARGKMNADLGDFTSTTAFPLSNPLLMIGEAGQSEVDDKSSKLEPSLPEHKPHWTYHKHPFLLQLHLI